MTGGPGAEVADLDGPAAAEIRVAIEAAGGAIPFEEFMRIALYGADGFYTGTTPTAGAPGSTGAGSTSATRSSDPSSASGSTSATGPTNSAGRAGRRGDFITSPEVGPLFGAVVGRFLDAEWRRLGEPDPFVVVDGGAGPGTLARAVLAATPRCHEVGAMRYVAVEVSRAQRSHHPDGIISVDDLHQVTTAVGADRPAGSLDGVVIANELLDNLPFRLAVFDSAWREAFVVARPDGTFAEVLSSPFDPVPQVLPGRPVHGARAPLHDAAVGWVETARSLLRSGTVVCIDYTSPITAALVTRPYRDWLRTYRGHERGVHPLVAPGRQDITTDVALDQLPTPDTVRTQAQWLQRWGVDELVEEGKRVWAEQSARPGLEAMRMRSRISEAEALLDPSGLGGFGVAEWRVGDGR